MLTREEKELLMDISSKDALKTTLSGRGYLTGAASWIVAAHFLIPLFIIAFKFSALPGSEALRNLISLAGLPGHLSHKIEHVLFVPLAALLIVIFRIALGIRVLGPFRSILLALAFQATGIVIGLIFLTFVVAVIVAVRPLLKAVHLPYFARVATALSVVVILIMIVLVAGRRLEVQALTGVAYFPIVVLCLTGDGFARTINREGLRSALWRGSMTALAAVIIAWLASIQALVNVLVNYPELILAEVGLIIIVSEFFGFRLLSALNPPVKKRSKHKSKKKKDNVTGKSGTESVSDLPIAK
jgi:hypothetical protein